MPRDFVPFQAILHEDQASKKKKKKKTAHMYVSVT
jgi:hypothetical protein